MQRDTKLRDTNRPAGAAPWRFEIAEGPNAGADVALPAGEYRLGSDSRNDIVLADNAMAPEHFSLAVTPQGASVKALTTGVSLARRPLVPGRSNALAHGAEIRVGGTLVRVHAPAGMAKPAPLRPSLLALGGLAGLVIAAAGSAFLATGPAATQAHAPAAAAFHPPGTEAAAHALRARLATLGLDRTVTVARDGRALLATGALLPADLPAWQGTQSWFDARFGRDVTLVDKTGAAATADLPTLDLAAISMAPVPNILTRDGERYTEGAVLKGGWSIKSITLHGVKLTRAGRDIEITS